MNPLERDVARRRGEEVPEDAALSLAGDISGPTPADRNALKSKIMALAKEARVMASGLDDRSSLSQAAGFLERAAQAVKNAKF